MCTPSWSTPFYCFFFYLQNETAASSSGARFFTPVHEKVMWAAVGTVEHSLGVHEEMTSCRKLKGCQATGEVWTRNPLGSYCFLSTDAPSWYKLYQLILWVRGVKTSPGLHSVVSVSPPPCLHRLWDPPSLLSNGCRVQGGQNLKLKHTCLSSLDVKIMEIILRFVTVVDT
jgi:hypothetical protein